MEFLSNYGLIILLVVLLGFMFWSSRRRMQKQKLEQEAKARQTVPGAEVLLQGGLYGTIVSYDPDNLDQPALVELAPGVRGPRAQPGDPPRRRPRRGRRDRGRVHRGRGERGRLRRRCRKRFDQLPQRRPTHGTEAEPTVDPDADADTDTKPKA